MALRDGEIDPASFTILRLGSGALVLLVIRRMANRTSTTGRHGSWLSALCLFVYALSFSYAYVSLSTGVGALILFGFVQATMITSGLLSGDRPVISEWVGWLIAIAGIAMLLLPGADKPDLSGALMMAVSGIAWGLYSVRGPCTPAARNRQYGIFSTGSSTRDHIRRYNLRIGVCALV